MTYSGLLYPTMVVNNKKGEVVYKHKDKGNYFLFQVHDENIEDHAEWNSMWDVITAGAKLRGIGLFDYEELIIASTRAAQALGIKDGKPTDITIRVFDHAAKEMTELVVGVTTKELPEHLKDVQTE